MQLEANEGARRFPGDPMMAVDKPGRVNFFLPRPVPAWFASIDKVDGLSNEMPRLRCRPRPGSWRIDA